MNVYLDSSVVVRRFRRECSVFPHWGKWDHAYSSALLEVETLRTLDRMRLRQAMKDDQVLALLIEAHTMFETIEFIPISPSILRRAAQPFSTSIATLDALHLATALRIAETKSLSLTFLTHDAELALAARSLHFEVAGV